MAFSKADLASMVKRAMFFLACAIVESEAKPFTLFRSRFEELLGDQTPVFALAFAFPMLATTFAMGSKHLTVTGRAEEVSRCSQRNQKCLLISSAEFHASSKASCKDECLPSRSCL